MTRQRPINLNPAPDRLEVVKITYPHGSLNRGGWAILPMRFIPYSGRAA